MILFFGAKINRVGNEAIQSGVEPRPSFASRHHLFGFDETEFVSHSLFCSPPSAPFVHIDGQMRHRTERTSRRVVRHEP